MIASVKITSTDMFLAAERKMVQVMEGRMFGYNQVQCEGWVAKKGINGLYAIRPKSLSNNWVGGIESKKPFNFFSGVVSLKDFRFTKEEVVKEMDDYEKRRVMKLPIMDGMRADQHFSELRQ